MSGRRDGSAPPLVVPVLEAVLGLVAAVSSPAGAARAVLDALERHPGVVAALRAELAVRAAVDAAEAHAPRAPRAPAPVDPRPDVRPRRLDPFEGGGPW